MAMWALGNFSIRQRLTGIILVTSTLAVLLTTLVISIIGIYNREENIAQEMEVLAQVVGKNSAGAIVFDQKDSAQERLDAFISKPSVVRACLYKYDPASFRNEPFATYPRPPDEAQLGALCPNDLMPRNILTDASVEVVKPVISPRLDDRVGYIYIQSSLVEIEKYKRKQMLVALFVTLAVLVVSYPMAVRMQRGISAPILSLAGTAREVSINKDFTIRAHPFREGGEGMQNTELGVLTNAFNGMLQEIGERDTRLKKQYVELERAKDAAEAANRSKSQFLANISHELRTPLNAIIGFSSILMNQLFGTLGDAKYLEYARDINESGSHLLDIINDILDLSKAEAGKLNLNFEEVFVQKAIQKCVTLMADRAEKGKITITTDIPKLLPPLVADRLRFIQIVLNVLSNAVKFTEEGGKVHITVATRSEGDEVTHFVVTIKDTGIGMSREDIHKAFQSFGQVDSGLNRKYEGTGLGLPLTKKLIELHRGSITIESELAAGTAVTLTFPAVPVPDGDDAEMPGNAA